MHRLLVSFDSGYIKNNGEGTLYVSTKVKGKKVKFNTGVSVRPEDFDHEKQRVKSSHPEEEDLNLIVTATKARINDIYVRYRLQFEELTPEILVKEFKNAASRIDFHAFLQEAIKERRGEISPSTVNQHRAMASKLRRFSPKLTFSQLDEDFMMRFNRWLINTMGNEQNTRFNTFKNLKAYLNIAVRKRIIKYNPLVSWMPVKQAKTPREYLTEDEVNDLVDLYDREFLPRNLQKTLRHFLFMCFTGVRISDLRSIEMENIVKGTLIYSAQKTRGIKKELVKVPLPQIAQRLLRDEAPFRLHGKVFNTLSEQQMRKKIKDIVKVVHINKDISLHTARHTFATMFLRRSKNIAVLQRLLGHSKIEHTMIYAHVLYEDIESEVEKAFERFS